jgi:hypothetical protein
MNNTQSEAPNARERVGATTAGAERSLRETCVWTVSAAAVYLAVVTDLLGVLHALSGLQLLVSWTIGVVGIMCWLRYWTRFLQTSWSRLWWRFWGNSRLEQLMALGVLALGLVTLVTALLAPPNNWDSMTYHMARVAHWKQNRSVDFYPTNISLPD